MYDHDRVIHCISISGGKDSTAMALLAMELHPRDSIRYVFADTGNEHELTLEYIDYLETVFDAPIVRLRANFDEQIAHQRDVVSTKWRAEGIPEARIQSVLDALKPTGNPYLDLCVWKGRFPSRKAQFCTQFLKTEPLMEYQLSLADEGHHVWSWQGVRADESPGRARRPVFEELGGGIYNYRPILRWKASDCFEAMAARGVKPNPLYKMGMGRVGCMPCINANKA